ncbi:hypothetical protein ACDF64_06935 [Agromyces sp. MMS24-JH15]|uniref:hypothetical protein n=1 Tax=Agromyces sp. MMS24-JH15 TaxID=3243765 RepID=UPI00374849D1
MKWVKRIVIGAVIVFALFYMINRPADAAGAVRGAFDAVAAAGQSIGQFFLSLAG